MDEARAPNLIDAIQANGGWVMAAILAAWGWMLRFMLGRHLKAVDRVEKKVDDLIERVSRIEGHMEGERR